ncbi:hypothetical protein O6H91_06G042600 [Diphasiastrum complanatum]|uniref:Uncharacterized protein n=1 Tax=Diphasiastrum complanatum TaxID=34168 RepID=A0ACC2DCW6_DIPCM|nr:hypothetical protein O6H91_06G042600 [Diphasiastrum complanatum]
MMRIKNLQSLKGFQVQIKNRLLSTQVTAQKNLVGEDRVQLLTSVTSPFANSIALALKLKGVQYEALEEQFPNKSQLLLDSNPVHKSIPVLIHNGKPVAQSLVLLEYIEDAWPALEGENKRPAFLSTDPYARSLARFWADFINQKLIDTAARIMITVGDEHEKAKKEVVDHFLTLNRHMPPLAADSQSFFLGSQEMGMADIVLSPFVTLMFQPLQSICDFKFPDSSKCPPLYSWISAIQQHPIVKSTTPDPALIAQKMAFYRQVVTSRARQQ